MSTSVSIDIMKTEEAYLLDAMERVAVDHGIDRGNAKRIFNLLPAEIQQAPAFKDKLGWWRYEFGVPLRIDGKVMRGACDCPEVLLLLKGLKRFHEVVPNKLPELFQILRDRKKHQDALAEFDPLIRIKPDFIADYESTTFSHGAKTIDWYFEFEDQSSCLLDVKHRITGLLNLIPEAIHAHVTGKEPDAPAGVGIFKSSTEKFRVNENDMLQGIWVVTDVRFKTSDILNEFLALDSSRIQFCVISSIFGETHLLCNEACHREWLNNKFDLDTSSHDDQANLTSLLHQLPESPAR